MPDRSRLRIALVAPPVLPIPPASYAGTERIVATLGDELHARGHHVTLFAPGDSDVEYELVATVPASLWSLGHKGDITAFLQLTVARAWGEAKRFDIIHSHAEIAGFNFARHSPTPVVTTLHGRLDVAGIPDLLAEFSDVPLVSISDSQRRWAADANWVATIHHGLALDRMPFGEDPGEYLAFVGRVTPEKGIGDAIAVARRAGLLLRAAAKVYDPHERQHFAEVVEPAIEDGSVEFLGEVSPIERDPLLAGARATLMMGAWPEPFGLVAIESMATGTPVIARRVGALTETIEHGVTGFLVDDEDEAALAVERAANLDRAEIRRRTIERFSVARMVDRYEETYRTLVGTRRRTRAGRTAVPRPGRSTVSAGSAATGAPSRRRARRAGPETAQT